MGWGLSPQPFSFVPLLDDHVYSFYSRSSRLEAEHPYLDMATWVAYETIRNRRSFGVPFLVIDAAPPLPPSPTGLHSAGCEIVSEDVALYFSWGILPLRTFWESVL